MIEKVYGFVIREGVEAREVLVYECPSMPEAGIQVPGGAIQLHETPVQAVARELLEGSGLSLGGWQSVPSPEVEGEYWHCFVTTPGVVLPDAWRCESIGREAVKGLRFEYRWIPLTGEDELIGEQEEARRTVASLASS